MNDNHSEQLTSWGVRTADGGELWEAPPVFLGEQVTWRDKAKLLFYPKKFLLYRAIAKDIKKKNVGDLRDPYRILDVGCGTGASVIDMKKLFGRQVDVVGADVIALQNDLARAQIKQHGLHAEVVEYDTTLPFEDCTFDAVYTSDVLGHVPDVDLWLSELSRVLVPGGLLAMFTESALGKHAYMRRYLMKRGLNTDPHAAFHISLYSKQELVTKISRVHIHITKILSTVFLKFVVHPDELYPAFQSSGRFFILRHLNAALHWLKQKLHPASSAVAEFYSLLELVTLGRWVESQGYIVIGYKEDETTLQK